MRVAEQAKQAGAASVDLSRYYADVETGKLRETDVVACFSLALGNQYKQVFLVIECKTKPVPWVIFVAVDDPLDDARLRLEWAIFDQSLGQPDAYSLRIKRPWPDVAGHPKVSTTLLKASRLGSGIAAGAESKNGDSGWEAVRSACSAAHGLAQDLDISSVHQSTFDQAGLAVFPVVVTSGKLVRAYLDENSELQVGEINRGELLVRQTTKSEHTRVIVITESALPELFRDAANTLEVI